MRTLKTLLLLLLAAGQLYSQKLYYVNMEATTKWAQDYSGVTRIKVHWDNPGTDNAIERQWVRDAVQETWGKYANIEFTGWQGYDYSGKGIRIYIDDYAHPHTAGLGNQLDGMYQGMVLSFNYKGAYKCVNHTREYCIKAIAVHEFGHALGIAHEQDRTDCGCDKSQETNSGGGYYVTPCDINSVMNYCNPKWNNGGQLSKYDVEGIQALYGTKKSIIDYGEKKITSSIIDKLGPNQVWENLYLTFGGKQFIFNINSGNNEEIKTVQLTGSGSFDYQVSSVSYNKDGKYYYGKGSGSLYLEKAKNYKLELLARNYNGTNFELFIDAKDMATTNNIINKNNNLGNITGNTSRFIINGNKPISLMLLDNVTTEKFYVYADGTIMVYNKTKNTYFECGKKLAPFYKDWNGKVWSWSFYRYVPNNLKETYVVSTTGEVWAYGSDNVFRRYGTVYYPDL